MHWYFQVGIVLGILMLGMYWAKVYTAYSNNKMDRLEFVVKLCLSIPIYAVAYILLWPVTVLSDILIKAYAVWVHFRARKKARDFFERKVADGGRNEHMHDVAGDR